MEETSAHLIRSQLRRLRTTAGLSQEEFGKLVHYSPSMVSAVETGSRPYDRQLLTRADEVLRSGGLLVALLRIAEREGQPSWFLPWLDAERLASQLRIFQPTLIPALLQTEGYARAVIRCDDLLSDDEARGAEGGWVASQEAQLTARPTDGESDVATLLARWETVRNDALSRQQSIELLTEVAKSWT
ncbi:Scr1 family TA system antitoxin-like transcriptional regulator [Micromonospora gifhornensis]|uniref:Scr1 family TA system antitoxin-like transcriptional regulator n=1 Tax=Micromonospora gifhornensis TaxID=84594 RepID=UPI00364A526F